MNEHEPQGFIYPPVAYFIKNLYFGVNSFKILPIKEIGNILKYPFKMDFERGLRQGGYYYGNGS